MSCVELSEVELLDGLPSGVVGNNSRVKKKTNQGSVDVDLSSRISPVYYSPMISELKVCLGLGLV